MSIQRVLDSGPNRACGATVLEEDDRFVRLHRDDAPDAFLRGFTDCSGGLRRGGMESSHLHHIGRLPEAYDKSERRDWRKAPRDWRNPGQALSVIARTTSPDSLQLRRTVIPPTSCIWDP